MSVSAAIFRRGGPKKEHYDGSLEAQLDDQAELEEKLQDLEELLHTQKIGSNLSAAIWRPDMCAAEVVIAKKNVAKDGGFIRNKRTYLHIEEAVFLVDRADLLLFVEEASSKRRLLSVQEAYDLMVMAGVSMERYQLYSMLCRSGYLVMRHPSRWLLQPTEWPAEVWGQGAWAACYGKRPVSISTASPPPRLLTQHDLGPSSGQAKPEVVDRIYLAAKPSPPSQTAVAAAMDTDAQDEPQQPAGYPAQAPPDAQQPNTQAAASLQHQGYWCQHGAPGSNLPWLPAGFADGLPSNPVVEHLGDTLRSRFPCMKPLERLPRCQDLGPSSQACHLVFDAYQPGSFVSRYKGVFPPVFCHIAVSTAGPPSLADMRAADLQSTGAIVRWASVDMGDISLYGIRAANLMTLI